MKSKLTQIITLLLFTVLFSVCAQAYELTVANYDYMTGEPINATVELWANTQLYANLIGEEVTFHNLPGKTYFGIYVIKENYKTKTLQTNYIFTHDVNSTNHQARYNLIDVSGIQLNRLNSTYQNGETATVTIPYSITAETHTGPVWRDTDVVYAQVTVFAMNDSDVVVGTPIIVMQNLPAGENLNTAVTFDVDDLGLAAGQDYDLYAEIVVNADALTANSSDHIGMTIADVTTPTIDALNVVPAETSAEFTIEASEDVDAQIDFGLTTSYDMVMINTAFADQHVMNLTGLNQSTLYYYRVTVCDASANCVNQTGTFTTLTHVNSLPVVDITMPPADTIFQNGTTIAFSCTATDAEDGNLNGNSVVWTSDIDGNFGNSTSVSFAGLSIGNHTINVTATDSDGGVGQDSVQIEVRAAPVNNLPTATITAPLNGSVVAAGDMVTFTGTGNDFEDGALTGTSLVWTSSINGQIGTGASFSLSNLSLGTHTITLTATDSQNATGTDVISVIVHARPVVAITAPANGSSFQNGTAVNFTGTATDAEDVAMTGADLVWTSSRDGQIGTGASFSLSNLSVGTHTITATATDSDNFTASASVQVDIVSGPVNQAPVVNITSPASAITVNEGASVVFTASATDAEDGNLGASIVWTSGNVTLGTGATITSVLSAGVHTVTATATDSGSRTGTDTVQVTVLEGSNIVNSTVDSVFIAAQNGDLNTALTHIVGSNVTTSTVNESRITLSVITNSIILHSTVLRSHVLDSYVENSNITDSVVDPSRIINSTVSANSHVTNSNITNSQILDGSNIDLSTVTDSVLTNVDLTNSTVENTDLEDVNVEDALIQNGVINHGLITAENGTVLYNNTGIVNVTDVINYAPVANAGADKTARIGTAVLFSASASSDLNIPGALNDTLTYAWNFGDNATAAGVSASHNYTVRGTFTVTLTVTDRFGASDTDTAIVTVSRTTGGSGGGSSRNSASSVAVSLDDFAAKALILLKGVSQNFAIKDEAHKITLQSINAMEKSATFTVESDLPATFVLREGETKKLDIDGGDYYDLTVKLTKLSDRAFVELQKIHDLKPGAVKPLPPAAPQTGGNSVSVTPAPGTGAATADTEVLPEPELRKSRATVILFIVLGIFLAVDILAFAVYLILKLRK
jgi:hypothetical protein